jgi:hypothetical protein
VGFLRSIVADARRPWTAPQPAEARLDAHDPAATSPGVPGEIGAAPVAPEALQPAAAQPGPELHARRAPEPGQPAPPPLPLLANPSPIPNGSATRLGPALLAPEAGASGLEVLPVAPVPSSHQTEERLVTAESPESGTAAVAGTASIEPPAPASAQASDREQAALASPSVPPVPSALQRRPRGETASGKKMASGQAESTVISSQPAGQRVAGLRGGGESAARQAPGAAHPLEPAQKIPEEGSAPAAPPREAAGEVVTQRGARPGASAPVDAVAARSPALDQPGAAASARSEEPSTPPGLGARAAGAVAPEQAPRVQPTGSQSPSVDLARTRAAPEAVAASVPVLAPPAGALRESARATREPPAPVVHIGRIDIVVEAPPVPSAPASAPVSSGDPLGRLYLRGL